MEFQELIANRRSVRDFKEGVSVSAEELTKMVASAQAAPTWKNSQTGRYFIATSAEGMKAVNDCLPEFNQNSSKNAAAFIVTTFEKTRSGFERDGQPTNELGDEWGAYDLGLQNALLVLAAKEQGFDTLIMGIRDAEGLRKACNIPDSQEVVAVIALGKRNSDPAMPKRKETETIMTIL